ncbi:hypothetical protein [Methylibium rhizosphaerae]|uniref:hypothetical protein n=1 Tax=Methylibium rhizosphaerae TaxID=2570323 RepID=UPI00112CF584|nr:hypothetical protein [Methylibium rhizosphaerae]
MKILLSQQVLSWFHGIEICVPGADLEELAFSGQDNGLCGSAIPRVIALRFGRHTGKVHLTVAMAARRPPLDDRWTEVVESPMEAEIDQDMFLVHDGAPQGPAIHIPRGTYRLRYSALDFRDDRPDTEPTHVYELLIWPAPLRPDVVIKVTSPYAAHLHHPKISIQ